MIRLLIFDAGHTLGEFHAPGQEDMAKLSPLTQRIVSEEMRRFLHCTPEPAHEVLEDLCEALHIDIDALPKDWTSGFTAFPYAAEVVETMIATTGAKAVVLSNVPCTTGPSRMHALQDQLPMIDNVYTSYTMRLRKPDRRLWQRICAEYGVYPSETVHFGDRWTNDVRGAIRAGCNAAVFVAGTREGNAEPPREDWPAGPPHIHVAPDLMSALPIMGELRAR